MTYEDIACMSVEDLENTVKKLLAIAQVVAILGVGMKISKELEKAARKFI